MLPNGSRPPVWFALDESRPLAFFAEFGRDGLQFARSRKGETTNDLFTLLTPEQNAIVNLSTPKRCRVIFARPDEVETWLTAPTTEAMKLQRPLPDDELRIVARGENGTGRR